EQNAESLRSLVQGLLEDTRDLIRAELALAKAEIREELAAVQTVGIAFGGAAFAGLMGATLLCLALGGALAYALAWPAWAGYGIIAVLLLVGGWLLVGYGKKQMATIRTLPKTKETVKENL